MFTNDRVNQKMRIHNSRKLICRLVWTNRHAADCMPTTLHTTRIGQTVHRCANASILLRSMGWYQGWIY